MKITYRAGKISLLTVLLAVFSLLSVACFGSSPTDTTTPEPPPPPAMDDNPVMVAIQPYTVVEVNDVSFSATKRLVYRIQLPENYTEAAAMRIAESIVEAEYIRGADAVNAIGFFFYFPGHDTQSTADGSIDWAPNGVWANADQIMSGDYSTFEYATQFYYPEGNPVNEFSISPETPEPTPPVMEMPDVVVPSVLTPAEAYNLISPAVAFVETAYSSGSGLLIEDNYILTAWHVTYPASTVRVVFSNGEEHLTVPVVATDPYRDLAIIGPIETSIKPHTEFGNGVDLTVGGIVFLVGYPSEAESFPQPAITQGIISRFREWQGADLTILQVDATILGGQSGGVLISDLGEVVGISNYGIGDEVALVNEISDLSSAIETLKQGMNPDDIGERIILNEQGGRTNYNNLELANFRDQWSFIIAPNAGEQVDINVSSDTTLLLSVVDIASGFVVFTSEEPYVRNPSASFEAFDGEVYAVIVKSAEFAGEYTFDFESSHLATAISSDTEDGQILQNGQSLIGSIDFPLDIDWFTLELDATQTIKVCVDSFTFDPNLIIELDDDLFIELDDDAYAFDEDSGGGFDNLNPLLTYTASTTGNYIVSIGSYSGAGGYEIGFGERCDTFLGSSPTDTTTPEPPPPPTIVDGREVVAQPFGSPTAGEGWSIRTDSGEAEMGLAQHLLDSDAQMIGAWWCPHCHTQKELFGEEAYKLFEAGGGYLECSNEDRTTPTLECAPFSDVVRGFPTWVINGDVFSGAQNLDNLATASGYAGAQEFLFTQG